MGFYSQNLGVQKLISSKKYVVCSKKLKFKGSQKKKLFGFKSRLKVLTVSKIKLIRKMKKKFLFTTHLF
jgi:hypothetical protein